MYSDADGYELSGCSRDEEKLIKEIKRGVFLTAKEAKCAKKRERFRSITELHFKSIAILGATINNDFECDPI